MNETSQEGLYVFNGRAIIPITSRQSQLRYHRRHEFDILNWFLAPESSDGCFGVLNHVFSIILFLSFHANSQLISIL